MAQGTTQVQAKSARPAAYIPVRERLTRRRGKQMVIAIGLLIFVIFMLGPVALMVIVSVSPEGNLLQVPPQWIPTPPNFTHHLNLLTENLRVTGAQGFRRALLNTVVVAVAVTVLCVLIGSLAGYAYARLRMPGRNQLILVLLFSQLLPSIAVLIPLFVTLRALNLIDNLASLIVLEVAFQLPFTVFILRGYFMSLPSELEDAAMVDGCGRVGALFRVIMPLSTPGLFAVSVFAYLAAWNAFLIPLVFTNSPDTRTAPLAVALLRGRFYTEFGLLAAAGTLTILVPVVLTLIFQRYILEGLVAGAIKG